jgi:hypothetical protein
MVERVILTAEGQVQQIEWKPPFSYIHGLKNGNAGGQGKSKKASKKKTSNPQTDADAGSLPSAFGAPRRIRHHIFRHPSHLLNARYCVALSQFNSARFSTLRLSPDQVR